MISRSSFAGIPRPSLAGVATERQPAANAWTGSAISLPAHFADADEGADAGGPGGLGGQSGQGSSGESDASPAVELLEFRSLERLAGRYDAPAPVEPKVSAEMLPALEEQVAALEARLRWQEENARVHADRARSEGRSEGKAAVEQEAERRVAEAREQVARLADRFRAEHDQYFRQVEREVVRLALAIAARVLHREAAMDPLLLAGAVRVALEKLADTSGLVLRTSPGEVVAWQEMFRLTGEARIHPDVVGDMGLSPGDCVLETRLGTVELGVRAQLEEIEKGFFDLLNQKPKPPVAINGAAGHGASVHRAAGHGAAAHRVAAMHRNGTASTNGEMQ